MNLTQRAQRARSLDIIHKRKCQSNPATQLFPLPFQPFNPFTPSTR